MSARKNSLKVVTSQTTAEAAPHVPGPRESASLAKQEARKAASSARPKMRVNEQGRNSLSIDHPLAENGWKLLMESLGTSDPSLVALVTRQLGEITQKAGSLDPAPLNQSLALVQGIAPRDEVEMMLATQMAAIHLSTMVQARRLHGADNIDQQNSSSNALNKLARTFAGQVETLKRYRTGGVQKVIVQHVQVNEGGQAVVAGELNGGGGNNQKDSLPHERNDMRLSQGETVLSALEALGVPVQGAGC